MRIVGRIVWIRIDEPYDSLIKFIDGQILELIRTKEGRQYYIVKDKLRDAKILVSPYFKQENLDEFVSDKEIVVSVETLKKGRGTIKEISMKGSVIPLGIGTLMLPFKKGK